MTCGRCKGLMVDEWRPDFSPETFVWRCINCGSIVDPLDRNKIAELDSLNNCYWSQSQVLQ
jgi:hypothetical protein